MAGNTDHVSPWLAEPQWRRLRHRKASSAASSATNSQRPVNTSKPCFGHHTDFGFDRRLTLVLSFPNSNSPSTSPINSGKRVQRLALWYLAPAHLSASFLPPPLPPPRLALPYAYLDPGHLGQCSSLRLHTRTA